MSLVPLVQHWLWTNTLLQDLSVEEKKLRQKTRPGLRQRVHFRPEGAVRTQKKQHVIAAPVPHAMLGILQPPYEETRQRNPQWTSYNPLSVQQAASASAQASQAWLNKLLIWRIYQCRRSVRVCLCLLLFFLRGILRRDYSLQLASVILKPC